MFFQFVFTRIKSAYFYLLVTLSICSLVLSALISTVVVAQPPNLTLANVYHDGIDLDKYWVSEKLDGVRAYWNGSAFVSRQGYSINAPEWFTADFPSEALDGELWLGRGTFDLLSGHVRRETPDEDAWRKVRYMVFDMPVDTLTFDQRLQKMQALCEAAASPYLKMIPQYKVAGEAALMRKLDAVIEQGGEGLMLHRGASLYLGGVRSDDLVKLKRYDDAEAVVIAHLPGKGKYTGMMGALLVETPDKHRFKIGTGFKDAERKNPPPLGATVTYKFYGLTNKGLPRFASFLRIRTDI